MAAVAPTSDLKEATELLQKLSLDSQAKTHEVPDHTKKYGSVDSGNLANGITRPFERSATSLHQDFMDPNNSYLPTTYYYGGYDGQGNDWEDYYRSIYQDGVEMPHGVYGENGVPMYHNGYGYAPYGTYPPPGSPVATMGHDGQLYGQQQYQYPSYYPTPNPTNGPFPTNQANASPVEVSTSVSADQLSLYAGTAKGTSKGGSLNGNNGSKPARPNYNSSSLSSNGSYGRGCFSGVIPASGYQDPRYVYDGIRSTFPWFDASLLSDWNPKHASRAGIHSSVAHANNLPSRHLPHPAGSHHSRPTSGLGHVNRMFQNSRMYSQYGNTLRTGSGYGSMYDSRTSGRGWLTVDNKYKTRGGRGNGSFGYGNENADGLNELNRGPRGKGLNNQKEFGPITLAVKGQNLPLNENAKEDNVSQIPDKEQYNREDFSETYSDGKFFVIKSYSEDDVHKSMKYNVWASTPNGNKKLDSAYQEAQEKPGVCPVFLLFSVNTSGQFVGLAEMVGPVDFNKSLEFWQQDKWTGCFPLKWHIIKDVPNSLLRHIILENNENKPVTNSRDTQEVKLQHGIEVIKIFKGHSSKTCIVDDFGFYEARQRTMQEKKARQQQFQQVWDGKPNSAISSEDKGKDGPNGSQNLQKSFAVASSLIKEPGVSTTATAAAAVEAVNTDGEVNALQENGSAASSEDAPRSAKAVGVSEKSVVSNEVASAC